MKKLILWSMLLVVCSCLVLVACDSDKPDAPPTNTNAETEAKTQTEAHVHAFCDWTTAKQPTCTEQGEQTRTCACGEVETQVIDALGHTEVVDVAVESTCAKTGLTAGKHCSVCDEVLIAQEEVAALGHTEVVDAAVAPTCTETGLTEGKHCSVCNGVVVAQKQVAALGHNEVVDAAVTPSCTANGLTQGKHCSRCNKILIKQNTIAATGKHTGKGYCTGCGLNYFNELANIIIKNGYRNDYGTMVYKYYSRGDVTVCFYYTTSGNIEVNVIGFAE